MIVDYLNKWNPGDIIGVKCLNGSSQLIERVQAVAKTWESYANIKFDFNMSSAPIRIKFGGSSNDSKIGTEFLTFPDPVTMNFANLHDRSSDEELNHKILHEFGHALGLVHEHFHPEFSQNLSRDKVMDHFKRNIGLSEAEIEQNVLKTYCPNQLMYSEFDVDSIMTYEIPAGCTKDGREIKRNNSLSVLDKQFIAKVYPFEPVASEDLIEGASIPFELVNSYDNKIYKIVVVPADEKRYYITTNSDNPIVLSLFRFENEGDRNKKIEYLEPFDANNEAIGINAKIELEEYVTGRKPSITEYYIRISCLDPKGTASGLIKISVV